MTELLAEIDEVVVASQPADDHAPHPGWDRRDVIRQAVLFGASSIADPWVPFFEHGWTYNGLLRDRHLIAHDFWHAAFRWGLGYSRPHSNQIRLFDPDTLK